MIKTERLRKPKLAPKLEFVAQVAPGLMAANPGGLLQGTALSVIAGTLGLESQAKDVGKALAISVVGFMLAAGVHCRYMPILANEQYLEPAKVAVGEPALGPGSVDPMFGACPSGQSAAVNYEAKGIERASFSLGLAGAQLSKAPTERCHMRMDEI